MKSWHYEMAERYFGLKIYKIEDVKLFVQADRISKEEFTEITGEDYDELSMVPVESNI
ncbi:XkdX family protein [Paraclostridium bifermentans]|jgi:uncharacterized XkdX family phage protein|uniref:XkdX family protein n=1 Tax=Paraclostridium bifermentans TaxID=1490 RepID=UPI0018A9F0F9|nr:XkdX family protein [Paraclostridium bifermentans]